MKKAPLFVRSVGINTFLRIYPQLSTMALSLEICIVLVQHR